MKDVSDFIDDALSHGEVETSEFTVDLARKKKVLAHALRDRSSYFSVHLLAAAALLDCPFLRFTCRKKRRWWFELLDNSPQLTVHFAMRYLSRQQLALLGEGMHEAEDRALMRLSLALNQLLLAPCKKVEVETVGPDFSHVLSWTKSGKEHFAPGQDAKSGLTFKIWVSESQFGLADLLEVAPFANQPVSWNSTPLQASHLANLHNACIWKGGWLDERFPLPCTDLDARGEEGSAAAFLLSDADSKLIVFRDGIGVSTKALTEDELGLLYMPGLVLLLNSPGIKLDPSRSRLVESAGLVRLLKDVLLRLRRLLCQQPVHPGSRLESYFRDFASFYREFEIPQPDVFKSRDVYSFTDGYETPYSVREAFGGQSLAAFSQFHVLLANLGRRTSACWLSFREPVIVSAAAHSNKPLLALALSNKLIVWNTTLSEISFELACPGLTDIGFTPDGEALLVFSADSAGCKVSALDQNWQVREEASESQGHFNRLSRFVWWRGSDPGRATEVRELGRLQESGKAHKWDFVSEVSPDGRWAVCSSLEDLGLSTFSKVLVDLKTGRCRNLPDGRILFSSDSTTLFVKKDRAFIKSTYQALSLPHLKTLGTQNASRYSWIDPHGVIRETDVFGKYALRESWSFGGWRQIVVDSKDATERVEQETSVWESRKRAAEEGSLGVALFCEESIESRSGRLACRKMSGWEPICDLHRPQFVYTADYLMWESSGGVFRLATEQGELRFLPRCFLSGRTLLQKEDKGYRFLSPLDGQPGDRITVAPTLWDEGSTNGNFQYLLTGLDKGVLVDPVRGKILSSGLSFCTTNGQWVLQNRNGQVRVKPLGAFKRWRKLGWFSSAVLHPSKPRVYLCKDGELSSRSLDKKTKPTVAKMDLSPDCQLSISPGGGHIVCKSYRGFEVCCAENLSVSCFLAPALTDEGDFFEDFCYWLTDRFVRLESQLWYSSGGPSWKEPKRRKCPPQDGLVSAGSGNIAVGMRAGRLDIVDLLEGAVLGTIHIWGDEWLVFTPEGRWDSSTPSLKAVKPLPPQNKRVPGLLSSLLRNEQPILYTDGYPTSAPS